MPFLVTVPGGEQFSTDDLTLDEAISIEKQTGESWQFINPLRSADHCKQIMVAFLARSASKDDALAKVGALSLKDVMGAVEYVAEDDLPDVFEDGFPDPKAEGD